MNYGGGKHTMTKGNEPIEKRLQERNTLWRLEYNELRSMKKKTNLEEFNYEYKRRKQMEMIAYWKRATNRYEEMGELAAVYITPGHPLIHDKDKEQVANKNFMEELRRQARRRKFVKLEESRNSTLTI